jgi:hypothetical protein
MLDAIDPGAPVGVGDDECDDEDEDGAGETEGRLARMAVVADMRGIGNLEVFAGSNSFYVSSVR